MLHKYTFSVIYYVKHIQTGIERLRQSVCPIDPLQQRCPAGLLLSAMQAGDVSLQLPALAPHTSCRLRSMAHTHTHTFNGPFSVTTRVSRYQSGFY